MRNRIINRDETMQIGFYCPELIFSSIFKNASEKACLTLLYSRKHWVFNAFLTFVVTGVNCQNILKTHANIGGCINLAH